MKKFILILILVSQTLFAQERELTLERSIEIGINNSKELRIANSRLKAAEAKVNEYESMFLPKISLSAGYSRLSDVKPFEVSIPFAPSPIKIQDAILDNYQLKLSFVQPLFTGFRLSSLEDAAEFQANAIDFEYQKELNEKSMNIRTAFWNYWKAQKVVELLEENIKSLKNHLKNTENFVDVGLATQNDLLKLEVQIHQAELKLIEAKNGKDLARANFNKEIGLKLDEEIVLKAESEQLLEKSYNLSDIVKEAIQNRNEIKSVNQNIRAGEEAVNIVSADWFPQINLFGNFYYNRPNQRIMPLEDKFNESWDVGVAMQWQIWDWGGTSSKLKQAEEQLNQAETSLQILKENIQMEVYSKYLNLKKEIEKVKAAQKGVKSAEENLRVTKNKYESQLATSSDLIDAEVYLLQAKTDLETAKADQNLAHSELMKSLGRVIY